MYCSCNTCPAPEGEENGVHGEGVHVVAAAGDDVDKENVTKSATEAKARAVAKRIPHLQSLGEKCGKGTGKTLQ